MASEIKAIDLFCGVGGLTYGLRQSGVDVVAGYDIDHTCRFPYEANNQAKFIQESVTDLKSEDLIALWGDAPKRLLAGCAPCQPFSKYTQARPKDERWGLLSHFGRLISETVPEFVTMENVPELSKTDVFDEFRGMLIAGGYHVWHKVVYCPDYGVPQNRSRLVLLASLEGEISLIPPTHSKANYVTLREAVGDLPPIKAGATCSEDPLHRSAGLTPINLKRIKASKPGGNWKDWPDELRTGCHSRDSGRKYTAVYGRMDYDEISPTVTTQFYNYGSGRYGHPEQDRAMSLREAALLQSFPRKYKFIEDLKKYHITSIARHIGNAVPPALGAIIGKSVKQMVG